MIVLLMGAPGSGKGTQAQMLVKEFALPHISTGDIFRNHIKNKTNLGKKAQFYIEQGNLVPDDLVSDIVEDRISQTDCDKGFILDGFPRTIDQAVTLDKIFAKLNKNITTVISFEIEEKDALQRLLQRQRSDDSSEIICKRFADFQKKIKPIVEYYKKKSLYTVVNGALTPQEVFERVLQNLSKVSR